jgi:hypothetical protein
LIFWINRCHYDGGFLLSFIILHFFNANKTKGVKQYSYQKGGKTMDKYIKEIKVFTFPELNGEGNGI